MVKIGLKWVGLVFHPLLLKLDQDVLKEGKRQMSPIKFQDFS